MINIYIIYYYNILMINIRKILLNINIYINIYIEYKFEISFNENIKNIILLKNNQK